MDLFRSIAEALQFSADKMKKNGLFATERFFCDVYAFEAGQNQIGHRHAGSDKIYYVLQGSGVFRVEGEEQTLGVGNIVFCPAGAQHAVTNPGPERLAVLVFMAPPPE
jgi:quercetin dioxygenase-like cupin family protein